VYRPSLDSTSGWVCWVLPVLRDGEFYTGVKQSIVPVLRPCMMVVTLSPARCCGPLLSEVLSVRFSQGTPFCWYRSCCLGLVVSSRASQGGRYLQHAQSHSEFKLHPRYLDQLGICEQGRTKHSLGHELASRAWLFSGRALGSGAASKVNRRHLLSKLAVLEPDLHCCFSLLTHGKEQ